MLKNILVTGGEGRFAKELQKTRVRIIFFRNKKQLNILSTIIEQNLKRFKPDAVLI